MCKGHNYPIARITFSADGALLLSGDSGRELVYWNAITGQQIMNVRSLRDVDWVAWNSTCGWPVEVLSMCLHFGILPIYLFGSLLRA